MLRKIVKYPTAASSSSGTGSKPDQICIQIVANDKIAVATKNIAIIQLVKSSVGSNYGN